MRFELKCGRTKDIEDLYINMLKTLPFDDRSADIAAYLQRTFKKWKDSNHKRSIHSVNLHS